MMRKSRFKKGKQEQMKSVPFQRKPNDEPGAHILLATEAVRDCYNKIGVKGKTR
jgi:hypothetical protein